MLDLRKDKIIKLNDAHVLKPETAFLYTDEITGKKLVAKLISFYQDDYDQFLIAEFKKMALLSAEPQIGTAYFLASAEIKDQVSSCYIMEYIEGNELAQIIANNQPLSAATIEEIICELAIGLEKAHSYGIFHGDLHTGNVLVDKFGNLKIIDFLWFNFNGSDIEKQKKDVFDFKDIVAQLISLSSLSERSQLDLIRQICLKIDTFKGLGKKLSVFSEISFELSLLSENSKQLLSRLLRQLPVDFNLRLEWIDRDVDVPPKILNEIPGDEKYQKQMQTQKNRESQNIKGFKYIDGRLIKLDAHVRIKFEHAFHELIQSGFCKIKVWVRGSVDDQWEPYKFGYRVAFSPKFVRWKYWLDIFDFLPPAGNTNILDLVFE